MAPRKNSTKRGKYFYRTINNRNIFPSCKKLEAKCSIYQSINGHVMVNIWSFLNEKITSRTSYRNLFIILKLWIHKNRQHQKTTTANSGPPLFIVFVSKILLRLDYVLSNKKARIFTVFHYGYSTLIRYTPINSNGILSSAVTWNVVIRKISTKINKCLNAINNKMI